MKEWHYNHFQSLEAAKLAIMDQIMQMDKMEAISTFSVVDGDLRVRLQEEFRRKSIQKEIKWKQRSRDRWIDEGDRNT